MESATERSGSCLCAAVRVSMTLTGNSVGACHCSMCRKWGGGPALGVEGATGVRFEGTENITVYSSSDWAERGFCSKCGTHLFYRLVQDQRYFLPVGLIDNADGWDFDHQIFVEEKPAFYSFANPTRNLTGAEVFAQFAPPSA